MNLPTSGETETDLPLREQLVRERARTRHQFAPWHDVVHQRHALRLLGRDAPGGKDQPHCVLHRDVPRQALQRAAA